MITLTRARIETARQENALRKNARRKTERGGNFTLYLGAVNALGFQSEDQDNLVVRCGDWHLAFQNETM